jgi:hypothetical protein
MKTIALIVGIVLLAAGIAGFIPGLAEDGLMLGFIPATMPILVAIIVAGAAGILIGIARTRELMPVRVPGHDLRDLGGA